MPAKGRIEVKIKFKGIPMASRDNRGYTKIEVRAEDGYMVLADVKTKTFKRFLESAREFDFWEGALNGYLHHIQGHQIILSSAGLQCYEKKPKTSDF